MNDQYYVLQNGQQFGPFPMPHIAKMWRARKIQEDALYWREGFERWKPLNDSEEMMTCHPEPLQVSNFTRNFFLGLLALVVLGAGALYLESPKATKNQSHSGFAQIESRAFDEGWAMGEAFALENYAAGSRVQKTEGALELTAKSKKASALGSGEFMRGFKAGYKAQWMRLAK